MAFAAKAEPRHGHGSAAAPLYHEVMARLRTVNHTGYR